MIDWKPMFQNIMGESGALLNDISEAPDRAACITGAAVLDDLLSVLLRARMVQDDKITRFLTSNKSDFELKIDLCYGFGLISEEEYRDLHLMRKIRNRFAHTRGRVSFEDSGVCDRLRTLSLANDFWTMTKTEPSNGLWFLSGWVLLANSLSLRIKDATHIDKATKLSGEKGKTIIFGGPLPE
jgi:hypothetical protein